MSSVVAKNLTKYYGNLKAVDSLTFTVPDSSIFAILGPNGAGKTTTLRILACIISPSSGEASVAGFSIKDQAEKVRRVVGILTENPALYERLTAAENLEFFAAAYGLTDKMERRLRIRKLLEQFGLWERKDDRVAHFSKGMKQKLAFIKAVIHHPYVLLLDEPTSNLDPASSHMIIRYMMSLRSEGSSVIISTHRIEDVQKFASYVMLMSKGRVIECETPEKLMSKGSGGIVELKIKESEKSVRSILKDEIKVLEEMRLGQYEIIKVEVKEEDKDIPELIRILVNEGIDIVSVKPVERSLEEVYMSIMSQEQV